MQGSLTPLHPVDQPTGAEGHPVKEQETSVVKRFMNLIMSDLKNT